MAFINPLMQLARNASLDANGNINFTGQVSTGGVSVSPPRISNIVVDDNAYTAIGAQAVDISGGYVTLNGTGFQSGAIVQIGQNNALATTFVSENKMNVQVPPMATGYYNVVLYNPDGSNATKLNGIQYSQMPVWVSNASYSTVNKTISYQLNAVAGNTDVITYKVDGSSSLPAGLTLSNTGLLSGTISPNSTTAYSFTLVATDNQLQFAKQPTSLTYNQTNVSSIAYADANFTVTAATSVSSQGGNIVVTGSNFVNGTFAQMNGSNIAVSYVNTTTINATVPALQTGSYSVTVFAPDGLTSSTLTNAVTVSVNYPSGGTVTTAGSYRIHTFTTSGTFTVYGATTVDYLIVGGGGAGAWNGSGAGGGGAGGLIYKSSQSLSAGTYTVTIGAGGARAGSYGSQANNGSNSDVTGLGPAYGGGAGGQDNSNGYSGGSGGGASGNYHSGGSGTGGQGNRGGSTSVSSMGAGGGGAGAVGGDASSVYYSFYGYNLDTAGNGGSGLAYDISGTTTYYAGGGGGGHAPDTPGGGRGSGGGGRGGANNGAEGGSAFTGGGGGGSNPTYSGDIGGGGGSGIVIIRYLA